MTPTRSVKEGRFPRPCEQVGLDLGAAYELLGIKRLPFVDELAKTDAPLFDRADIIVFFHHVGQDGREPVQHYAPADV